MDIFCRVSSFIRIAVPFLLFFSVLANKVIGHAVTGSDLADLLPAYETELSRSCLPLRKFLIKHE